MAEADMTIKVVGDNAIATSAAVALLIQSIGEDVNRPGLRETPDRVARAWSKWTEGYGMDVADILKVFDEENGTKYDQMVVVKDIPVYSKCEHHLADIFGTATVAYIPNGRVVGLSKLSRLVNMFARRLQVQERMTVQIADALFGSEVKPLGVAVHMRCRHMCMESRGLCQQGHFTMTTALRGALTEPAAKSEFMSLVG